MVLQPHVGPENGASPGERRDERDGETAFPRHRSLVPLDTAVPVQCHLCTFQMWEPTQSVCVCVCVCACVVVNARFSVKSQSYLIAVCVFEKVKS